MRLGLIGFGNIAGQLLALASDADLKLEHLCVLTLPEMVDDTRDILTGSFGSIVSNFDIVTDATALLQSSPDLVVECAGHAAVLAHVPTVLHAGTDVIVVSIGALADQSLYDTIYGAAEQGNAQIVLPSGAIGGIDLLAALSGADGLDVVYRGVKPPNAWVGTPAEQAVELDKLDRAETFFSGNAREAAMQYPKNANVAATLALAGAGFEATKVELVADPAASGNSHSWELRSSIAKASIMIENLPSADNIKTSVTTIYSVLREIRNRMRPVVI